jgi:hypothetical protein
MDCTVPSSSSHPTAELNPDPDTHTHSLSAPPFHDDIASKPGPGVGNSAAATLTPIGPVNPVSCYLVLCICPRPLAVAGWLAGYLPTYLVLVG